MSNNEIKTRNRKVEVEKSNGQYKVYFLNDNERWKSLEWSSHATYGKELGNGGNIKANDGGKARNKLRIWEPNSELTEYKMEAVSYDGWGKVWGWKVEISDEHLKILSETVRADIKKRMKKMEWHIKRAKNENQKIALINNYNSLESDLL